MLPIPVMPSIIESLSVSIPLHYSQPTLSINSQKYHIIFMVSLIENSVSEGANIMKPIQAFQKLRERLSFSSFPSFQWQFFIHIGHNCYRMVIPPQFVLHPKSSTIFKIQAGNIYLHFVPGFSLLYSKWTMVLFQGFHVLFIEDQSVWNGRKAELNSSTLLYSPL